MRNGRKRKEKNHYFIFFPAILTKLANIYQLFYVDFKLRLKLDNSGGPQTENAYILEHPTKIKIKIKS